MHKIQRAILNLSDNKNISNMTLREIGQAIGEGDVPQKIKHHLNQLEAKGLLKIIKEENKVVGLNNRIKSSLMAIPIMGAANCGEARSYAENYIEGYLRISDKILTKKKDNLFAIRAVGNSMNRANIKKENIEDGDYVIVDSSVHQPSDGSYVLSVIDGVANIKKFKEDKARHSVILMSESSREYPPIILHKDDVGCYYVAGEVIQVIKTS
ncbi:MAG: hypothetical protein UT48_C0005G0036 [Parcubacteria group bacterium GW2011_GWE2_39_37]|nr:MAG: hypothetical protein UT48_C0005G0036 [Parcubacteria group bacterium GW2011_GWE2_39_37]